MRATRPRVMEMAVMIIGVLMNGPVVGVGEIVVVATGVGGVYI